MKEQEKVIVKRLIRRSSIMVCLNTLKDNATQLADRYDEAEEADLIEPTTRIVAALEDIEQLMDQWRGEYQKLVG